MPRVRVLEVVRETADARSLVLQPLDFEADYRPGQFLTIKVPGGAARCYSLSSSPERDDELKVTVKRTRGGYASNWICDNAVAGSEFDVLRPAGTFVPAGLDRDLLLLAGGSGITPVLSILKTVLHAGTGKVALVYANRDERSVIFRDELVTLAAEFPDRFTVVHWLESVQGRPTRGGLQALVARYTARDAFVCGPGALMDLAVETLQTAGFPDERINLERFTSLSGDPFAAFEAGTGDRTELEVRLDGVTTTVEWPSESTLLEAAIAGGLDVPYSCREGSCGACACLLRGGTVALSHNEVLDDADLAEGMVLSCQARPTSPTVQVTFDG
ncbi:2Fe-2S iron-sulfur cluster-binding protein [Amycolatopsis speibonae]|uniref:2Fe-2S iron-sulfur cluster-binding protein n=1 Tax=Amycolatopsis speibonae TaxID=1450224 RepID=A0ABV7P635_9PSEU